MKKITEVNQGMLIGGYMPQCTGKNSRVRPGLPIGVLPPIAPLPLLAACSVRQFKLIRIRQLQKLQKLHRNFLGSSL